MSDLKGCEESMVSGIGQPGPIEKFIRADERARIREGAVQRVTDEIRELRNAEERGEAPVSEVWAARIVAVVLGGSGKEENGV